MKRTIAIILSLLLVLGTVPALALTETPTADAEEFATLQAEATEADESVAESPYAEIWDLLIPDPTSTLDNERIVKAKYLLAKNGYGQGYNPAVATSPNLAFGPVVGTGNLTGDTIWGQFRVGAEYADDPEMKTLIDALYKAEALLWAFNCSDIYTGDPAAPVTRRSASLLSNYNTRYGRISSTSGLNRPELLNLPEVVAARALYTTMNAYSSSMNFGAMDTAEGNAGTAVRNMITSMDPNDNAQVAAARAAFDALAPYGKARVTNYETLKKAEGIGGKIPANLKNVSQRAPSNGQGYTTAQWVAAADKIKSWLPNVPVDHIWIAGMLDGYNSWNGIAGVRINVDFATIATDGKYAPPGYEPLTQAEWRDKHISFGMAGTGRPTHLEFLDAFDKSGVGVYLQIENGYADTITLMDIYRDIFEIDKHPSVKGFAVDVEWYFGFFDDTGIPVPNDVAQKWNEHLYKTWGPGYRMILKHYNINAMPYTYRGGEAGKSEKIIFCTDSQGTGSTIDSITTGFHTWAAQFPDNPVNRQTGYAVDRNWFWGLQAPTVKSLAVRLADCAAASPNQEIHVTVTQALFNDPAVFWMGTDAQAATALNTTLNMLSPTTTVSGHPGYRYSRGTATLADAMFVFNARTAYNALPDASAVTAANLANLVQYEPVAVDVRIKALPALAVLANATDGDTVSAIWDTYQALTAGQQAEVKEFAALQAAKAKIDELNAPSPYAEIWAQILPMPTSTLDNERIVKAKYLLRRARIGRVGSTSSLGANAVNLPYGPFVPEGVYATDPDILAIRDALYEAEARLWAYNLMDLYSGDPAKPIDRRQSSLLSGFNTRYGRISSALGRPDLQQLPIVVEARALYETMNAYRTSAGYATMDTNEANAASPVVTLINNMNWDNPESVAAARTAYDALAPRGKARVTNYDLLKKAEGTYGQIPANITSVGGRAPSNGNGYSIAQWQNLADQLEGMFPSVPTEHIWIAGMLSGGITSGTGGVRVNVDFNSIATDGKYAPPGYAPLTLAEWRDQHIDFAMSGTGRPTHEEFLTYYDSVGTKVWLQVENGYADMITLIDIYKDIFKVNQHPSVLGFAVDVEWYFGVEEDMGIPVPNAKAKEWNEHIYKTWGPAYGLLLKHYTTSYLPYTYRGGEPGLSNRVVFCNDSQGSTTVASYMQGFQDFAAMYPDNKIVDQVGYAPDRAWFMALTDPVVKSKSVMLAESALASPTQEKGIVWVQGTFNDPLTFYLGTDAQAASAVNSTLGYLVNDNLTSWTSNDSPGYRLRRTLAGQTSSAGTLADAMFVQAMRKSVNALPNGESNSSLTAARVDALKGFEPVAVDIRVRALPATANLAIKKDSETVYAIWDTYQALTAAQKAEVKEFAALQAAKAKMDELCTPVLPVLFENGQWATPLGEITVQTPRSINGHYMWSYDKGMIRLTNDVSGAISTGGQNSIPFRWQFQNTIDIRGYSAVVFELDSVPTQPFLRQLRFRIDEDNTTSGTI
ncbi:MAG: hypothetical protein FWG42_08365, partial [Clostridiales bacterium]|nr:hypothetical protein [Clostridiales bacterium]